MVTELHARCRQGQGIKKCASFFLCCGKQPAWLLARPLCVPLCLQRDGASIFTGTGQLKGSAASVAAAAPAEDVHEAHGTEGALRRASFTGSDEVVNGAMRRALMVTPRGPAALGMHSPRAAAQLSSAGVYTGGGAAAAASAGAGMNTRHGEPVQCL